jgi:L-arabinose transport system ATP-binding protein
MQHYLKFQSVSKVFPGVKALDSISFEVNAGSVHGLLGENGAGKSTLLKILSGAYIPTSGEVEIDGKVRRFHGTKDAIDAGIAVIYQELNLVPDMTVEENLLLGHMPLRHGLIDKKTMTQVAREALASLSGEINPKSRIRTLSIGQRQLVEIAKALIRDAKVIAFDEPTSSLSDREVQKLFSVIKDLQGRGRAILYVSHRLEEVFQICDSITVFRDGRIVKSFDDMSALTNDILIRNMVGREIKDIYDYRERPHGERLLEVKDLTGPGLTAPASFEVSKGEILGFFGLVGAGRTELMKLVFGAEKPVQGTVSIAGKVMDASNIGSSIRNGLVLCPEDRKLEGIIPISSVSDNINLSVRRLFSRFGFFINRGKEAANTDKFIEKLSIKTPSSAQLLMNLSGGNQQKVILARWLSEDIRVIILDEPTRGIDVGTKSEIYQIMYSLAESGMCVVFVSSELPEILGVADRILVMRSGKIVGSLSRNEATEEKVLKLALPVSGNV